FDDPGRHVRRHVLNQTGRAVYELLDGERTVADIIDVFLERFPDVPDEQLREDIIMLIRTMQRKGVIEQVHPPLPNPSQEAC
ncbi:MAG: PqqD family protein, partial [Armatimonadota bacterium]